MSKVTDWLVSQNSKPIDPKRYPSLHDAVGAVLREAGVPNNAYTLDLGTDDNGLESQYYFTLTEYENNELVHARITHHWFDDGTPSYFVIEDTL